MILFIESSKTASPTVDTQQLRSETEAPVERHRSESQLQHGGQCGRIVRGFHPKGGQILRREIEGPSPSGRGHLYVPRHSDGLGVAELGVSWRELRQILHGAPDIRGRLKDLALI